MLGMVYHLKGTPTFCMLLMSNINYALDIFYQAHTKTFPSRHWITQNQRFSKS